MITLLSDFGYEDAYVAIMKGVIAAIAPHEATCDLTHSIAPQDILSGRFNLKLAYPHFPSGTVHLAVVDPGVGAARNALAIRCSNADMSCFLVGPDNGLLSGVLEDFISESGTNDVTAVVLTNPQYWRSGLTGGTPSETFHGRDIFAPVAAHIANGVALEALGDRIHPDALVKAHTSPFKARCQNFPLEEINRCFEKFQASSDSEIAQTRGEALGIGCIQHVDRFGNLISNIPESIVCDRRWKILLDTPLGSKLISRIKTYSDAPFGSVAALIGSHGWVEIACNRGSALAALGLARKAAVGTHVMAIEAA